MAQDRVNSRAVVIKVMNIRLLSNVGNLLRTRVTVKSQAGLGFRQLDS
jgi:hypothetical protein